MRRKVFQVAGLIAALSIIFAPGGFQAQASGAGTHVIAIDGISTINSYCQYEWKSVNGLPVRDELGIPQPVFSSLDGKPTAPPKCRTTAPTGCTLKRNLGPYPKNPGAPDLTQAEVGLNPPCSGKLTGIAGVSNIGTCADATTGLACGINTPTWFYGYCGQTYGGQDNGGFIKINGNDSWTIDIMGFARGRGFWEFNGKLQRTGYTSTKFRMYLAAVPNKLPDEAAGCDGVGSISSIEFTGVLLIGDVLPVKAIRSAPGWHPCADDPNIPNKPQNVDGC